ncbi:MAG: hypothetical protein AABW89_03745 [Nanoarchaeota archaeon]
MVEILEIIVTSVLEEIEKLSRDFDSPPVLYLGPRSYHIYPSDTSLKLPNADKVKDAVERFILWNKSPSEDYPSRLKIKLPG